MINKRKQSGWSVTPWGLPVCFRAAEACGAGHGSDQPGHETGWEKPDWSLQVLRPLCLPLWQVHWTIRWQLQFTHVLCYHGVPLLFRMLYWWYQNLQSWKLWTVFTLMTGSEIVLNMKIVYFDAFMVNTIYRVTKLIQAMWFQKHWFLSVDGIKWLLDKLSEVMGL